MNKQFFIDQNLILKDSDQWKAYRSMRDTVIIAGPGSGKTRVLSLKAVALARTVIIPPKGLVCISYSRETVRELRKRLNNYGYRTTQQDFVGTIHSFSLMHILQPFAHLYPQYGITFPIKIAPREVLDQIYEGVLRDLKVKKWNLKYGEINRFRSLAFKGLSQIEKPSSEITRRGATLFEEALFQTPYLDFISIINFSAKIIQEQEFVRKSLEAKYPWILIDEYQDLGKGLHEMVVELLFNTNVNIYAVGDINQSIYGFAGGYPEFLEELMKNDEINAIRLHSNYRSTQHVINASMDTLQLAPPAPLYVAKLRSDEADFSFITCKKGMGSQYQLTANRVIPKLLKKGVRYGEMAVILATNAEVKAMSQALRTVNIPFYIANWNFENSNVVVWLQDCAAWCVASEQQSFEEIFNVWYGFLIQHQDQRMHWERIRLKVFFHQLLTRARTINDLLSWLQLILKELKLSETLKHSEPFPNEVNNLATLLEEVAINNLRGATVHRFSCLGSANDEVTLTTRHSAKGLEFEAVILLGMEEGRFPYTNLSLLEMQEAQRLCYVCVSRAKSTCVLIRSLYHVDGYNNSKWKAFAPSRFWTALQKNFGSKENTFDEENFL